MYHPWARTQRLLHWLLEQPDPRVEPLIVFPGAWQPSRHDGFTTTFISDTEKDNPRIPWKTFMVKWELLKNVSTNRFFNGWISKLGFRPETCLSFGVFLRNMKVHSNKIPRAKWPVPQTPQFTTSLSPPRELLAVMEVLNELGFLGKRRHAPHVKPIIKTQSQTNLAFYFLHSKAFVTLK